MLSEAEYERKRRIIRSICQRVTRHDAPAHKLGCGQSASLPAHKDPGSCEGRFVQTDTRSPGSRTMRSEQKSRIENSCSHYPNTVLTLGPHWQIDQHTERSL